jgi:type VI protein secretion system component VasF
VDHKEKHHQHHEKEREEKKKEQHQHELAQEKQPRVIHPLWFGAVGLALVILALFIWTIFLQP